VPGIWSACIDKIFTSCQWRIGVIIGSVNFRVAICPGYVPLSEINTVWLPVKEFLSYFFQVVNIFFDQDLNHLMFRGLRCKSY